MTPSFSYFLRLREEWIRDIDDRPIYSGNLKAASDSEFHQFKEMLITGLESQDSSWKGYIYHFTHVENAVSILKGDKLLSRQMCQGNFLDSAGDRLISHTRSDVLSLVRFYFRLLTPTQWHNELLGKRNKIYALCPVPIFLRFSLTSVLETHARKCMISDGNLAASKTSFGNSLDFLNQRFDFDNVYGLVNGKGKAFKASQQEFVVDQFLDLSLLPLESIQVICRNNQDKQTLVNLLGTYEKYNNRIFTEQETKPQANFYHSNNPYIRVLENDNYFEIEVIKYADLDSNDMFDGDVHITSDDKAGSINRLVGDITDVCFISDLEITVGQKVRLQADSTTKYSVYFREYGKEWLIYTNEFANH